MLPCPSSNSLASTASQFLSSPLWPSLVEWEWAYVLPKQGWLWTRLLRAWTTWTLKNPGMEMAQLLGITCSAASLSSLGNSFFHLLECGLMCAVQRGTIPYLDLWAVPLFVRPRSCRMPLLPRHSAHHRVLHVVDKDVTGLRTDPCSSPSTWCWSLGGLKLTQSLSIQPASYLSGLVELQSFLFLSHPSKYCVNF